MKKYRLKWMPPTLTLPEGFYSLIYTNHARDRFIERNPNDPVLPSMVNITKLNTIEVYTEDDKEIIKVLVKILYRKARWGKIFLYLVVLPKESVVKTLWFEEKIYNKKQNNGTI